jgi:hypothetical protein
MVDAIPHGTYLESGRRPRSLSVTPSLADISHHRLAERSLVLRANSLAPGHGDRESWVP